MGTQHSDQEPSAEATLAGQRALLDFAVTHSPAVFYLVELGGEYSCKFISANVESLTGHTPESFLSDPQHGRNQIHPDDLGVYNAGLERLRTELALSCEYRFRHTNGEYRWYRDEVRLTPDGPEDHGEMIGCFIDITAEKQAQEERDLFAHLVKDAVESLSEGFALWDHDDRLIICNSRYRDFHSISKDILVPGVRWSELIKSELGRGLYVDALGREDEWLQERIKMRREMLTNLEYEQSDGRWVSGSNMPTRQGGLVVTLTDITDRKLREAESTRARQMLEDAIESLPEGFVIWDENDQFVMCNQLYREINSISADALKPGVTWKEFIRFGAERGQYADAVGRVEEWVKARSAGRQTGKTTEYQLDDGRWVLTSSQATRQGGRVATRLDITERKKLEESLRESEELVRKVLEACPAAVAMNRFDDGEYIYVSPANRELLDLDASAKRTNSLGHYVDPDFRDRYVEILRENGRVDDLEVEFKRTDGSAFWASMSSRLIEYQGEKVIVSSLFDLTERKLMEDALRDSEELVRRVLEACPLPLSMSRVDSGEYIYGSPSHAELLGISVSKGQVYSRDTFAEPRVRDTYAEQLQKDGRVDDLEVERLREDGSPFWASMSSRLIEFQGEEVIVSSLFDLTERRAAEAEIERQRTMLHQTEKLSALGELLAGISHELNNPLTVLMGQALMLKEKATDEQSVKRAERINEAAERCSRIVKSFLALAHQKPNEPTEVDLNQIVEEAIELTSHSLRTTKIDVTLQMSDGLPLVMGDPDQLRQVLTNLIINARHALEEIAGERTLTITTATSDDDKSHVVIGVTDNGPGVPSEIRSRIFEPLFTTKEVGKGTGIGLALCHRVMQAHNGAIKLEQASGGGTTFALELPLTGDTAPAESEGRTVRADSSKLKVLIVTDDPTTGAGLVEIFTQEGHGSEILGSSVAGLERLKQCEFDAVFCDARLPGSTAEQFRRSVQAVRPGSAERLAFITDSSLSGKQLSLLDATGRPFIESPFRPKAVWDLVDLLLRRPVR